MTFNIPNIFVAGRKAVAQDVNENFEAIKFELNRHSENLIENENSLEKTKEYMEDEFKKSLTDLIRVGETKFCLNSGRVGENGKNNSLYSPHEPTVVTKALPYFSSTEELVQGKSNIKVTASSYGGVGKLCNIVGKTNATKVVNGYTLPLDHAASVTIDLGAPKKLIDYTAIGSGDTWTISNATVYNLAFSNDGVNFVEYTELSNPSLFFDKVPFVGDLIYRYVKFYNIQNRDKGITDRTAATALGALNITYQEIVDPGDAVLAFAADAQTPVDYTTAKGRTTRLEGNLSIDLSPNYANFSATVNIFINNDRLEGFVNSIYRQPAAPATPVQNDIWFRTFLPLNAFKFTDGKWVEYDGVPVGSAIIKDGVVLSVENAPYDTSGYHDRMNWDMAYPDYAKAILKSINTAYYADKSGFVGITLTSQSSSQAALQLSFNGINWDNIGHFATTSANSTGGTFIYPMSKGVYYKAVGTYVNSLKFYQAKGAN